MKRRPLETNSLFWPILTGKGVLATGIHILLYQWQGCYEAASKSYYGQRASAISSLSFLLYQTKQGYLLLFEYFQLKVAKASTLRSEDIIS